MEHFHDPNSCSPEQKGITFNGWDVGSRKRWDRWHSPSPNWQEKYHLYTTYSPCRTWGVKYAIPIPPNLQGTGIPTIDIFTIPLEYIPAIWATIRADPPEV